MATFNLPPRQKMINLLYVILIAMLAINISSDVLNGFITNNNDLEKNIKALQTYSSKLDEQIAEGNNKEQLESVNQALQQFIEQTEQVKSTIRKTAQQTGLITRKQDIDDDLNAVKEVMFGENGQATIMKEQMNKLKAFYLSVATQENSRLLIADLLSTDAHQENSTWEEEHFANLPIIGGMMMLNKMERNAWLAANEVKKHLCTQLDTLMVSPKEMPQTEINNDLLDKLIAQIEKRTMQHKQNAPIVKDDNGKIKAMVLTENMAPLFADYENKLNITIASSNYTGKVDVTLTGGQVKKVADYYVAIPDGSMNQVTLTVKQDGKTLTENVYNVVPLPTPKPFLTYTTASGKVREYRSNVPMTASELVSVKQIDLKMDAIHTGEEVQSFDLILIKNGNKTVITEHAQGATLTNAMKQALENVVKGDKLFFTNILIKGTHTQPRQTVSLSVIPM